MKTKNTLQRKVSMGIDLTPKPTTNNRDSKCIIVVEEIAEESPWKISLTESIDSRKFDTSLALDT